MEATMIKAQEQMKAAQERVEVLKNDDECGLGSVWWMKRTLFEADKFLPWQKQHFNHRNPFVFDAAAAVATEKENAGIDGFTERLKDSVVSLSGVAESTSSMSSAANFAAGFYLERRETWTAVTASASETTPRLSRSTESPPQHTVAPEKNPLLSRAADIAAVFGLERRDPTQKLHLSSNMSFHSANNGPLQATEELAAGLTVLNSNETCPVVLLILRSWDIELEKLLVGKIRAVNTFEAFRRGASEDTDPCDHVVGILTLGQCQWPHDPTELLSKVGGHVKLVSSCYFTSAEITVEAQRALAVDAVDSLVRGLALC